MSVLVEYPSSDSEEDVTKHHNGEKCADETTPVLSPTDTHVNKDFFGISDDSDSSCSPKEETKSEQMSADTSRRKEVMVHGQTSNSEFWMNADHVEYKWTTHIVDDNDTAKNLMSGNVNQSEATKQSRTSVRARKRKLNETPIDKQLMKKEGVKFYIHHRIKPYLHQTVIQKLPSTKKLHIPNAHHSAVNSVNWNSGQYSHLLLTASMDKSVKVWNLFSQASSQPLATYAHHDKAVKKAVWCSQGKQCLSASYDKTARLIDVVTGQQVEEFNHSTFVTCVQPHTVDQKLFVTGCANHIMKWDMRSPKKAVAKFTYKDTFGQVQDLAFIENGSQLVSCNDMVSRDSTDRNVMLWDFRSGVVLSNQIYQERYTCTRLLPHPSRAEFVAQSQGNYIAIFSTLRPYKMNKCKRFEGHKVCGYNIGCSFSPDGSYLYSGSSDGRVYMYNYERGKLQGTLGLHPGAVCMDVAAHPLLPSALVAGTWDGELWLWE